SERPSGRSTVPFLLRAPDITSATVMSSCPATLSAPQASAARNAPARTTSDSIGLLERVAGLAEHRLATRCGAPGVTIAVLRLAQERRPPAHLPELGRRAARRRACRARAPGRRAGRAAGLRQGLRRRAPLLRLRRLPGQRAVPLLAGGTDGAH